MDDDGQTHSQDGKTPSPARTCGGNHSRRVYRPVAARRRVAAGGGVVMLIVEIVNDGSGTQVSANYTYQVRVNNVVIAAGRYEGHNRDDGWQALLKEIAEKSKENDIQ